MRGLGDPDTVREALAVRRLVAGSFEVRRRNLGLTGTPCHQHILEGGHSAAMSTACRVCLMQSHRWLKMLTGA